MFIINMVEKKCYVDFQTKFMLILKKSLEIFGVSYPETQIKSFKMTGFENNQRSSVTSPKYLASSPFVNLTLAQ